MEKLITICDFEARIIIGMGDYINKQHHLTSYERIVYEDLKGLMDEEGD